MANGQPRPAFFVAVLLVVVGLVGLALWRYGAIGPSSKVGQFTVRRAEEDEGRRRSARHAPASRRSRNTTSTPAHAAARGQGHLRLQAAGRPHGALRASTSGPAGRRSSWPTTASSRARSGRRPSGKDFKVELVLIDDPVAMRDAYAAGDVHIGWAHARHGAALRRSGCARTRASCRASTSRSTGRTAATASSCATHQDGGRPARQDGRAGAELAVALLRAQHAGQRRRAAVRSRVQVHRGRLPGGRGVQRATRTSPASSAGRPTSTTSRRSRATGCWSPRRRPTS